MRKVPLAIMMLALALSFAFPAFLRAGAPVINSAQLDLSAHTITIAGTDFGSAPPTVTLGAMAFAVTDYSPTTIRATLPAGLAAGSYHLLVSPATTPPGIASTPGTLRTLSSMSAGRPRS